MRSLALALVLATLAAGGTLACREEGPAERAGEAIDEAGDDAQEALDDAGDAVQDAAEDVRD